MKIIISTILIVCLFSLLMPVDSRAAEAQNVPLTNSELTSLNAVDNSSLDSISAGGKGDNAAPTAANIVGTVVVVGILLIPIIGAATILF
jgi:hypothetical protein